MSNKRACPMLHTEVIVEDMCYPSCGHHNKTSTACMHATNMHLVEIGIMKQADFDSKDFRVKEPK